MDHDDLKARLVGATVFAALLVVLVSEAARPDRAGGPSPVVVAAATQAQLERARLEGRW